MRVATGIHAINYVLTLLFGVLLYPFKSLDPIWGLTFVSVISGILMVWIFGRVSDQQAIEEIKRRIQGNLLGVRLYQHEIGVVMRLHGQILRDTLRYMRHSIIPMLVLLIPVLLILVQVNQYFSTRPLRPGEAAVLKVSFKDPSTRVQEALVDVGAGVKIETPPVRSAGTVAWRIRAENAGRHRLSLRIGETSFDKEVVVGDRWDAVSPLRTLDWLDQLLYSGESPLDSTQPVSSVEVRYRPLDLDVWGWSLHWLVVFFVVSIVAGYSFKGWLGVEL